MEFDLLNVIDKAEVVLVGIGREWSLQQCDEETLQNAYKKLHNLLKKKVHFIVTLNTDDLVYRSFYKGFVTAPCGSDHRFQCPENCNGELFQEDFGVCPNCGRLLVPNTIAADKYNEEGYLKQWQSYNTWLQGTLGKKLLILELGVDFYFHQIIRFPFEKIAEVNQRAYLTRVNALFPQIPANLSNVLAIKENSVQYILNVGENLDSPEY